MGRFDILEVRADKKKDNKGKLKDITKVQVRMQDTVNEDLLEYLNKS